MRSFFIAKNEFMKLQYSFFFFLLLMSLSLFSQKKIKPHACHPPIIKRNIEINDSNKATPAINATGMVAYTQSIHNVIVKWQTGSFSTFSIGTAPGLDDIRYTQGVGYYAKHTTGHS